jgi:uncharacterized membrane protein
MGGGPRLSCSVQERLDPGQDLGGDVDPLPAGSTPTRPALEYLHRRDTALAGLQYSYLPSWISFLVDKDEAAEAGIALYRHVHRRWAQLPAGDHPGWSSSARAWAPSAAEAAFHGSDGTASLANLVAGSDGALFTGPNASNHIWDQFTDDREPRSPVWRPVYAGGTSVQFANRPARARPDLAAPSRAVRPPFPRTRWGTPTVEAFWNRSEWTDRPQGYDIPARVGWFRSSPASRRSPTSSPASAPPPATATTTASTS